MKQQQRQIVVIFLLALLSQTQAQGQINDCYPYFQKMKPGSVIGECLEDNSDSIQKFKFSYFPDTEFDPNFKFNLDCITPVIKIQGYSVEDFDFEEDMLSFKLSHQELYEDYLCQISNYKRRDEEEEEQQTMECNIEIDLTWGEYVQHQMDHSTAISYYVNGDSIVEPVISPTIMKEAHETQIKIETSLLQCNEKFGCSAQINDLILRTDYLTLLAKVDETAYQKYFIEIKDVEIRFYQNNNFQHNYMLPDDDIKMISYEQGETKFEIPMSMNLGNYMEVVVTMKITETKPQLERRNLQSEEEIQIALNEYRQVRKKFQIEEVEQTKNRNMYSQSSSQSDLSSTINLLCSAVLFVALVFII